MRRQWMLESRMPRIQTNDAKGRPALPEVFSRNSRCFAKEVSNSHIITCIRHAELGSAPILGRDWALKQVQGDVVC